MMRLQYKSYVKGYQSSLLNIYLTAGHSSMMTFQIITTSRECSKKNSLKKDSNMTIFMTGFSFR